MIFLKKQNTWKYEIFFKCSEKIVFPKKLHRNMIFLVLSGKLVPVPPKLWVFFSFFGNLDELSREIHGNMAFFVYMYKFYKYDITLLPKKNQRWSPHEKIHLQVIEILDGHSRKCYNDSLFSMEIVSAFSCIVFQRKKNEEI